MTSASAHMDQIREEFQKTLRTFMDSRTISSLMEGRFTVEHYKSVLRQIFHHTRENPQLQSLSTVYFRGHQREVIRRFYRHATSEIGHDQLALNDYRALGGDAALVPYENPLPATLALLGYGFYEVYNRNPLAYLGYLFFLEFTPTSTGNGVMEALKAVGVPDRAMTFLKDHTLIDVSHNRLMEGLRSGFWCDVTGRQTQWWLQYAQRANSMQICWTKRSLSRMTRTTSVGTGMNCRQMGWTLKNCEIVERRITTMRRHPSRRLS